MPHPLWRIKAPNLETFLSIQFNSVENEYMHLSVDLPLLWKRHISLRTPSPPDTDRGPGSTLLFSNSTTPLF